MAFCYRAKRDLVPIQGTTGEEVGPGSYSKNYPSYSNVYASAPFASTSKRFKTKNDKDDFPGVGAYDSNVNNWSSFKTKKKSTSVFKSNTNRFVSRNIERELVPAPGAYETEFSSFGKKRKRIPKPRSKSKSFSMLIKKKKNTVPSIPSSGFYGYEEKNGKLIKQRSKIKKFQGTKDNSVGPQDYRVVDKFLSKYKSIATNSMSSFKSKSKRDVFGLSKKDKVPGPGSYGNKKKKKVTKSIDPYQCTSSFSSTTKRMGWMKKRLSNTVGPGSYQHYSSFKSKTVPKKFQNFGSSSVRPLSLQSKINAHVPGPGSYGQVIKEKETFFGYPKHGRIKHSHGPFLSTSKRFESFSNRHKVVPGVGRYKYSGLSEELKKKKRIGKFGIFGSTSKRFGSSAKSNVPPVGQYNPKMVKDINPIKKKGNLTSVFASSTLRNTERTNNIVQPGPGDYSRQSSWIKKKVGLKRDAFLSSSKRFYKKKSNLFSPAPGNYEPDKSFHNIKDKKTHNYKSSTFGEAPRFKTRKSRNRWFDDVSNPAPGEYDVTPTWEKKSFNVTIV